MGSDARPSAMIVAVAALVAGLAGTAIAGPVLTSAKKKKSESKADTKLVNKLAKNLSVKHAKTADSATTAGTAANATHATSADTLGGQGPGAFVPARRYVTTNGLVKLNERRRPRPSSRRAPGLGDRVKNGTDRSRRTPTSRWCRFRRVRRGDAWPVRAVSGGRASARAMTRYGLGRQPPPAAVQRNEGRIAPGR